MIVAYVSGHGFGHSTRTRTVLEHVAQLDPRLEIHIRTLASSKLFPNFSSAPVEIEPSVVETADALTVDGAATAAALDSFALRLPALIEDEAAFLRSSRARLVLADIPFAAGLAARRAGIPAIAMGNFTWDWILEPFLSHRSDLLEQIRAGYREFNAVLRMPLTQPDGWHSFRAVKDVPLVAPRSSRSRDDIRRQLRISAGVRVVLIGGRGQLPALAVRRVARENPDLLFLTQQQEASAPNLLPLRLGPELAYSDAIRASDVVVSKLGYSIAAECIAERKPLLYPPRSGFREELVLAREVPRYLPAIPIPAAEYQAGHWSQHLWKLLAADAPGLTMCVSGAAACAEAVLAALL